MGANSPRVTLTPSGLGVWSSAFTRLGVAIRQSRLKAELQTRAVSSCALGRPTTAVELGGGDFRLQTSGFKPERKGNHA